MNKIETYYDELKQITYNITRNEYPDIVDDLFHDCILILLEHPKCDELLETGEVKYFFTRIVINNWRSKTSPTYKKYKKMKTTEITDYNITDGQEYDYDKDMLIEQVLLGLDEMLMSEDERHRELAIVIIQYYSNGENFTKLGKLIGQDRSMLGKKFKKGIKILKEEYIDEENLTLPKNLSKKIIEAGLLKQIEPKETFEDWVKKNRIKFYNPKLFNGEEKRKIYHEYNTTFKVNDIPGKCGSCFYKRVSYYRELYLEDQK